MAAKRRPNSASHRAAKVIIRRYLQSLAGCVYFFLGGVFRERHRPLLYTLSKHFGFEHEEGKPVEETPSELPLLVPSIEPDVLCERPFDISLTAVNPVDGNVSSLELVLINYLVRRTSPKNCFEIGTFDGRTTLNIALNSPPETRIFTLDLPASEIESTQLPIDSWDRNYINKERSGARYVGTQSEKKITQLYGDSANFDFSPYWGKMNLVFVDASHSYEYVKSDSAVALRLLKDGQGMILWHDYNNTDGVTRALNELYENDARFSELRHIKGTWLCYLNCT